MIVILVDKIDRRDGFEAAIGGWFEGEDESFVDCFLGQALSDCLGKRD